MLCYLFCLIASVAQVGEHGKTFVNQPVADVQVYGRLNCGE